MKKRLFGFVMLLVLLLGTSTAQATGGNIFVGGNFHFSTQTDRDKTETTSVLNYTESNFDIGTKIGYFLADNIAIGAGIGFSNFRFTDEEDNRTTSSSSFAITPFARYFLGAENFGLFGEAVISLGFGGTRTTYENITIEGPAINTLTVGAIPGIYYNISENFTIEAQFGFVGLDRMVEKQDDAANTRSIINNLGLNLDPTTLTFGLLYRL